MKRAYVLACVLVLAMAVVLGGCEWQPTTAIRPAETHLERGPDPTVPPNTVDRTIRIRISPAPLPGSLEVLPVPAPPVRTVPPATPPAPPKTAPRQTTAVDDGALLALCAWPAVDAVEGPPITAGEFADIPGQQVADANSPGVTVDIDGRKITAPPGSSVEIELADRQSEAPERVTGSARNAEIKTNAKDIAEKLKQTPPDVNLPDVGKAKGGSTAFSAKLLGQEKGPLIFYVFGGLLIVGGVVLLAWLRQFGLGIALVLAGVALIAVGVLVEQYPWVLALGLVACLAVGGVALYRAWKLKRTSTTLSAVVAGVEAAPAGSAQDVKDSIGDKAESQGQASVVKDTVTAIKRELGIA